MAARSLRSEGRSHPGGEKPTKRCSGEEGPHRQQAGSHRQVAPTGKWIPPQAFPRRHGGSHKGCNQVADFWPPNRLNTISATAPTLMAESATLNTGNG